MNVLEEYEMMRRRRSPETCGVPHPIKNIAGRIEEAEVVLLIGPATA